MINTQEKLSQLIERAFQCDVVALDTEFVWERSYYPHLGVVQLALSADECFLIDILALNDLSPLARLLETDSVQKILHDALQDLVILSRHTHVYPKNIFDTRLAAGFAGLRSTISLRDLVLQLTGVNLAKTESRTNWLMRPLNPEQIDYALDDVRYLFAVREAELNTIEKLGNLDSLVEELKRFDSQEIYQERPLEELYLRVKGITRLNARQLAILRELAALRETVAMQRDIPRGWVIPDDELILLSSSSPRSEKEVTIKKGLWGREDRYYSQIIEAISKGQTLPESACPTPRPWKRDEKSFLRRVDALMKAIQTGSEEKGIDPQLVASRSDIKQLLNRDVFKTEPQIAEENLSGWRKELILEAINQQPF
jgi:ribonuclease D